MLEKLDKLSDISMHLGQAQSLLFFLGTYFSLSTADPQRLLQQHDRYADMYYVINTIICNQIKELDSFLAACPKPQLPQKSGAWHRGRNGHF